LIEGDVFKIFWKAEKLEASKIKHGGNGSAVAASASGSTTVNKLRLFTHLRKIPIDRNF